MEIVEIINKIEIAEQEKEAITEALFNKSVEVAAAKKKLSYEYGKIVHTHNNFKLPKQIADGRCSDLIYKYEVLEAERLLLYNSLENKRQSLNSLLSMLKIESELIK